MEFNLYFKIKKEFLDLKKTISEILNVKEIRIDDENQGRIQK